MQVNQSLQAGRVHEAELREINSHIGDTVRALFGETFRKLFGGAHVKLTHYRQGRALAVNEFLDFELGWSDHLIARRRQLRGPSQGLRCLSHASFLVLGLIGFGHVPDRQDGCVVGVAADLEVRNGVI